MKNINLKLERILFSFFVIMAANGLIAQNYIINTIAGSGIHSGYSGDGGPATVAKLNSPNSLAVDALGDIYVVDYDNHCIRKINSSGIISTIAGVGTYGYSGDGGPATSAKMTWPTSISLDGLGNIFIADRNNYCIRKINSAGIISTFAGNGTQGYSGDGGAATSAMLGMVTSVFADNQGNVYIGDATNNRIRKVDASGVISTFAGNGTAPTTGDGGQAIDAGLSTSSSFAVDASGNLYFTDLLNHRIRKITPAGIITTIAGNGSAGFTGDGVLATTTALNRPSGLAIDSFGNIYFADVANYRIRKIDNSGVISTIAGVGTNEFSGDGGLATAAELSFPSGVAVGHSGNFYIADSYNNRIRELTVTASITDLLHDHKINLYPNPADQTVNIKLTGENEVVLKLMSVTGQVVLEKYVETNGEKTIALDIQNLRSGVYFVKIDTPTVSQTIRFLKN